MERVFTDADVCKDVEAVCSKCGGDAWHIIVAVANGAIAQVECKQCGNRHKYKPIARSRMTLTKDTKTSVAAATREGSPLPKKKSSSSSSSSRSSEPKILQPKVDANSREIQKYSIKSVNYRLGDRIEHVKFGLGVVDEFPTPGKMYVTFETERVLLVYGK